MAIQLIRSLSSHKLSHIAEDDRSDDAPDPAGRPLLLQETDVGAAPSAPPEFHSKRLDRPPEAPALRTRPRWLGRIARLESSGQQAIRTLTAGRGGPGMPAPARDSGAPTVAQEPDAAPDAPATDTPVADLPDTPASDTPGPDGFAPRFVANADIRPGDAAADPDRAIRDGLDINRRAIERATAERSRGRPGPVDPGPDYLAMEDKAIDRLLETTNALLEADDHARKNQSLHRLKAAVAATEAERKIRVKTATGTVTLDFDERSGTRQPVADLLAAPSVDPEKRRQRLQEYRKMIAGQKKRP